MSLIPAFSPRTGNSRVVPPPSTTFEREGNGIDCNGHGSHVAGTIGGQTFGVAKNVRLLGVRVLNCQGAGTWSDVIDGVNFVTWHRGQPAQQGTPALANMSLGGGTNRAVDVAVRNSIRAQVTYVVAAGNGNSDAATYSPAGVSEAITVGATNQSDSRAEFSNYGSTLDLFAPGVSIPSAWIGRRSDDRECIRHVNGITARGRSRSALPADPSVCVACRGPLSARRHFNGRCSQ